MFTKSYSDPFNPGRTIFVSALTRSNGVIPGCIAAPHDKSLLELNGISPFSTADAFCRAMALEVQQMREKRLGKAA